MENNKSIFQIVEQTKPYFGQFDDMKYLVRDLYGKVKISWKDYHIITLQPQKPDYFVQVKKAVIMIQLLESIQNKIGNLEGFDFEVSNYLYDKELYCDIRIGDMETYTKHKDFWKHLDHMISAQTEILKLVNQVKDAFKHLNPTSIKVTPSQNGSYFINIVKNNNTFGNVLKISNLSADVQRIAKILNNEQSLQPA